MIYIVLPVHNRKSITERLIHCLKKQSIQEFLLVLIDDGSTDGTSDMVKREIGSLVVIRGRGIWWWGGALHQAYLWLKENRVSSSDFILIMNDDTEIEDDFIENGLRVYGEERNLLLQAQCYSKQTKKLLDMGVRADWKNSNFVLVDSIEQINCLSTRGLLFRYEVFERTGGFHPTLLPHYASDFEFTIRAYRKGIRLTTDQRFKLWLDESTTGTFQLPSVDSFSNFIKQVFSIKYASNPIFFTNFVALACPWRWKLVNWYRIWNSVVHQGIRNLLAELKNH